MRSYLLSIVRDLSIVTAKSHPGAMRFIPGKEPVRCLILRISCSCGKLIACDSGDTHVSQRLTCLRETFFYP
ncbi:unnamed protein product [Camellia sinensis]